MYSHWEVLHLKFGCDYGNGFGDLLTLGSLSRCEGGAAWHLLRPQILRAWMHEDIRTGHAVGPGSRPYAWWLFDAPERRSRIDGKPHPFDNPERIARVAELDEKYPHTRGTRMRLYFGIPNCSMMPDDFEAIYESQAEYIERLNLWEPGEVEAGIPVLTAEIAALRQRNDPRELDLLRRAEAMLKRLTKRAATA